MLIGAIVYEFDAVEVGENDVIGWRKELQTSLRLRALVYPIWSVFNPLNIFDKTLLVTKTSVLSIPITLLSLLGTLSVAFTLLALRRRFKLE